MKRAAVGAFAFVAAALSGTAPAQAVTSTRSVPSVFSGNGHSASFDGRLHVIRAFGGWEVRLLRPEAVTYLSDGLPDANGPMWSPAQQILGPETIVENALAICEPDKARAPYACDAAGGSSAGGPYACYDVMLFDSDALGDPDFGGLTMRRRNLTVWVQNPKTANASIYKYSLDTTLQNLQSQFGYGIRGIEPTVTADGKLLVWQGHPTNYGKVDTLVYSVNTTACAQSGWSFPKTIAAMATDSAVVGKYRLADRALRAVDGTPFAANALVRGAYPWLMPNGDALVFTAANMACRTTSPEDPPGCGRRRNALSVLGYPTNWGIAHIDGDVNPSTTDTVRLFFSSPGPKTFSALPKTKGTDVWPFFGSNTSNYVELVFDDGLDGKYAGLWHLNESVDAAGDLDPTRTPDVSGYFNTGVLKGGLTFAANNDGVVGKSLTFDGIDDHIEVPDAASLSPVNGITIDFQIKPATSPDCDAKDNYRVVLTKGSYVVTLEDDGALQARIIVNGKLKTLKSKPIPMQAWTHAAFELDGQSGKAAWFVGDTVSTSADFGAGSTIDATPLPLRIGGPGTRTACPAGDGAFAGALDEVSISRISRHYYTAPIPDAGPDATTPPPPPPTATSTPKAPEPAAAPTTESDSGCAASPAQKTPWELVLGAMLFLSLAVARSVARARRP